MDMINVDKIIDGSLGIAENIETGKDRQKILTERQKIDLTSRYLLPQIIRPIIALVALLLQIGVFVSAVFGVILPEHIVYEVGVLNAATIGFYFNSRRNEKINAKKVEAAIHIEKIKADIEIKKEKEQIRESRREKRLARRIARKTKLKLKP